MSHLKFTHRLALLLALLILFPVGAWARAPQAYITNFIDNTVSVIDTATNTVTAPPVPVGQFPQGVAVPVGVIRPDVAVLPDGAHVSVGNFCSNTVSVIGTATNAVTATVMVGLNPEGIAVTPDGAHVYVGNFFGNTVSVIDTATNGVIK